jgi:hypothetical protein
VTYYAAGGTAAARTSFEGITTIQNGGKVDSQEGPGPGGAWGAACPRGRALPRTGTCCIDAVVWRLTQAGTTQGEPQQNRTVVVQVGST